QPEGEEVDGWRLRRLVLHPTGQPLWAVYGSPDTPPGNPLVVQLRGAAAGIFDVAVLNLVVLLAALAVFRRTDSMAGGTAPLDGEAQPGPGAAHVAVIADQVEVRHSH